MRRVSRRACDQCASPTFDHPLPLSPSITCAREAQTSPDGADFTPPGGSSTTASRSDIRLIQYLDSSALGQEVALTSL
jgi:hypothetical protein